MSPISPPAHPAAHTQPLKPFRLRGRGRTALPVTPAPVSADALPISPCAPAAHTQPISLPAHLLPTPNPPKTVQGSYILDLKAETQRNHDLSQQIASFKAKLKEATSKHKQLQRDHARLLDRKLEGDRRVGSLQQKLQQLRTNKQAGEQSSSSAAAAAAAGPVRGFAGSGSSAGLPGSSQAVGFSAAAGGAVAAEQQARLAAEAKVSWLVGALCQQCVI